MDPRLYPSGGERNDAFKGNRFVMTASGAIPDNFELIELNNASAALAVTLTPKAGRKLIITQTDTGTQGHVVTMPTTCTFDGTNWKATFNARYETLVLIGLSDTRWALIVNIGEVALAAA